MTGLLIVLLLAGLVFLGFSVYVLALSVSTMRMHRQAMHALHQKLAREAITEQLANRSRIASETAGHTWPEPPAGEPRR